MNEHGLFSQAAQDSTATLALLGSAGLFDTGSLPVKVILITMMVFALMVGIVGILRAFAVLRQKLETLGDEFFRPLRVRSIVLLNTHHLRVFTTLVVKGMQVILILGLLYLFMVGILILFPHGEKENLYGIIQSLFLTVAVTLVAYGVFRIVILLEHFMKSNIVSWKGTLIVSLRYKKAELLSEDRIVKSLLFLTGSVRTIFLLAALYVYLIVVFSFFPFTRNWSSVLMTYILGPLSTLGMSFVRFLPNLFYIAVVSVIALYVIRFFKLIFLEISKETIIVPGFYPDWAMPSYNLVRIFVIVLAAIVLFPYIPGLSSPGFQGITVFLGVLISLGSTSAISNMVAGLVITYMRPFKVGDRVKIADTMGDIVEKTLLVTRVKTVKNVIVTIPNAIILGNHIINYSSSALESGLILNTSVTIGYDAPWRKVHELLTAAAGNTEFILKQPKPFVLQKSLDDFSVRYELNAFTDQPQYMERIYSVLHANIQDRFNEAGVEIMSPHFSALRDGNRITIPDEYLALESRQSWFRSFFVKQMREQKPEGS